MRLDAQAIGKRIRKSRIIAGISQDRLNGLVGYGKGGVYQLEHGKAMPTAGRLAALSSVLHVSPEYILYGMSVPARESYDYDRKACGRRIMDCLLEVKGKTIDMVCMDLDMHNDTFYTIRHRGPSYLHKPAKIADYFGVDLIWLLFGDEQK